MSIFESFADKPNQIREEGQEITLRFSRIDDNTGKVTWSIPPTVKGCEGKGAYNGIVITVSDKPANYIESSPKDGKYYIGDPTADPDMHSGSKIQDNVLVVGAFYEDTVTTELEVFDLEPRTPYYFSGYAVDNVARYHREGVHSYSLPTGPEEGKDDEMLPARHGIQIEEPIELRSGTGLKRDVEYKLKLLIGCKEYEIPIRGEKAQNYKKLIDEIHYQISLLEEPYKSPYYPFKDAIFILEGKYYLWDGQNKSLINYIESNSEPNIPVAETLWYDTDNNILFQYESSGWNEVDFIESDTDITTPSDNSIWFDKENGIAWIWKEDKWCKLNTIVDTRNPLLPPLVSTNTFWYNTDTLELFNWNKKYKKWDSAEFTIYYASDPNNMTAGDFWLNENEEKVYILGTYGEGWNELQNVTYSERDENGTLEFILDEELLDLELNGHFWYIPSEQRLFRRVVGQWEETTEILFFTNNQEPNIANDNNFLEVWWNPDDQEFNVWDYNNQEWKTFTNAIVNQDGTIEFILNQPTVRGHFLYDPSVNKVYEREASAWVEQDIALYPREPDLSSRESCDVWWNSTTDEIYVWDEVDNEWTLANKFYQTSIDPSKPPLLPKGSIWFNPKNNQLMMIMDTNCVEYDYINLPFDPTNPPIGFVWKQGDSFFMWNGSQWILLDDVLIYSHNPFDLPEGTYWLRTTDNTLYIWDGAEWIEVNVLTYDPKPEEGFLWLNTTNDTLYKWYIDKWVEATGMVYVEFIPAKCPTEKSRLVFKTREVGCEAVVQINNGGEYLFAKIGNRVRYELPLEGQDNAYGTPMYQQLGVGDDGSPDERRALHDTIRQLLGAPAVKVELSKTQIDTCINNALNMLRKYGGHAYKREMFFLDLKPNQQIYELRDRCVGFHKIVGVNSVYRLRSAFLRGAYSGYDIYGYAALKQLYTLGTFDTLSFHMVSSFIEELEHLFATRVTFQWVEKTRELKLYNSVHALERVLVDGHIERTEQDLMVDRETSLWVQRWAVAEAKMALSQSRGKFQSLPGPNGSTVLNAQELITQSEAEKAVLMEELEDASMSGSLDEGLKGFMVLG